MVDLDFEHLAQCVQSLRHEVQEGHLPEDEFDRFIDRIIWAIHSSPDNSPTFNHATFVARCRGLAA